MMTKETQELVKEVKGALAGMIDAYKFGYLDASARLLKRRADKKLWSEIYEPMRKAMKKRYYKNVKKKIKKDIRGKEKRK